jgi:hypothetical protein
MRESAFNKVFSLFFFLKGEDNMNNNFKFNFMFNKELKTLYDLRTDEDRRHYNACAYDDEEDGKQIDRFLSGSWTESEDEDPVVITCLESKINRDLYHYEYGRPITTRWKPLAARGKGAIVEILYYGYKDDWNRNGGKPWYSVIRYILLNPYIPVSERTNFLVLRFWEKGYEESSNFYIGVDPQMPVDIQVLRHIEKFYNLYSFDCCTHVDVCGEDKKTKIFTAKLCEDGKFYISRIY